MADVEVTQDNTGEAAEGIRAAIAAALEEVGLVAEGYAKRLCPVDTGRIRGSITHVTTGNAAYIGSLITSQIDTAPKPRERERIGYDSSLDPGEPGVMSVTEGMSLWRGNMRQTMPEAT